MEYYFIYLCNGIPTLEEKSFTKLYIQSLLPCSPTVRHSCSSCLTAPLLKCHSSYLSLVTSSLKSENVEWKEFYREADLDECTSLLQATDANGNPDVPIKEILSTHIHCLADQLPVCGSFRLVVIINYEVLKDLSFNEDIEFSGALYRLHKWHGASITITHPNDIQSSDLKEWREILGAELVSTSSTPTLSSLIWKGSIQLPRTDALPTDCPGFELKLEYYQDKTIVDYATPSTKKNNSTDVKQDSLVKDKQKESEHLILSPIIRVVDEYSFNSIPPYMIFPLAFKLCCKNAGASNKMSEKLLDYIGNRNGAALIVRMGFSLISDKPRPDKALSTTKWLKMITSSNIKFPDACLPSVGNYVTFALTRTSRSRTILAYPLRDTSKIDAQFYFSLIDRLNSMPLRSTLAEGSNSEEICTELKLPFLSSSSFESILSQIHCLETSNQAHFSLCLNSLLKSAVRNCKHYFFLQGGEEGRIESVNIDPTDWPERIHLLQKLIQSEKKMKDTLSNKFQINSPRRSQCTVSFSTEDANKYFHPSGEARDLTNAECISPIRKTSKEPKVNFIKVLETKWPEVTKCSCDDLYYNSNKQAEEKEKVGNEMARVYVQHETASTCNRQQLNPDAAILVRSSSQSSVQKWRSPAKYSSPSKRNQAMKNRFNGDSKAGLSISRIVGGLVPKHAAAPIPAPKISSSELKNLSRRQLIKKSSQPVRCSPRKKSLVMYSQPTSSRNSSDPNRKQALSQQLPDLAKKKLRVAVVTALESNNVSLNDRFFRPCFKRLFSICQTFVQDMPRKKGSTSEHMQRIADAHVKHVIEFEMQKD